MADKGAWLGHRQKLIILFTTVSLLGATAGYGQTCTPSNLQQSIVQLQDHKKRGLAQTALKQCGEPAVKPLIKALSQAQPSLRLAAAQTLGQMGWVAKSAVPALASISQTDQDLQSRSGAVQALSTIARSGQT
ncbi:MAG TPA: HEAT repeat domain-containing protein, partial [Coleofasciculaceae cyanobacterium]